MSQYVHHVSGRLRLKFAQLKNQPALARATECAIRPIKGITSAETTLVTGSLLIRYDAHRTEWGTLFAELEQTFKQLGLVSAAPVSPSSRAPAQSSASDKPANKLLDMLLEKCIERSVVVFLGALL